MEFLIRKILIVGIGFLVVINESVGKLPEFRENKEYLVDVKVKEILFSRYAAQFDDLSKFRDQFKAYKQVEWITGLISVVNQNKLVFTTLFKPICGINSKVVSYANDLAQKGTIQGFDSSISNQLNRIVSFAEEIKISVTDSFLLANVTFSTVLKKHSQRIVHLDEYQLDTLVCNMDVLRDTMIENDDFIRRAVNNLLHTLDGFLELTKKIGETMHKLYMTIKFKIKNVEQQRGHHMEELKQLINALNEMLTPEFHENIKQNLDEVKSEVAYTENEIKDVCQKIEDVILDREIEQPQDASTSQPIVQPPPQPPKKQRSGKVQELISFYESYKNQVTLREFYNQAKHNITLKELLMRDQINLQSVADQQFVKTKISAYDENVKKLHARRCALKERRPLKLTR